MAANMFSCCLAKIWFNFNMLACFTTYVPITIVTYPSLSLHAMDSGNERSGGIERASISHLNGEVSICDAEILYELTTSRGELKVRNLSFNEDKRTQQGYVYPE
uniref:Boron transporter 4-like n=1 Tax=Tanacetum cinerariifolium TaxID=118510 RepID=A0A6L2K338_TANCI|nr:boron transporter 4-like [Tanacetum cinerariifolium]